MSRASAKVKLQPLLLKKNFLPCYVAKMVTQVFVKLQAKVSLSKLPNPSKGWHTSAITKFVLKLNPEVRSCTVLTPKIPIALPSAALSCRS